jgi:hypothetical protein
VASGDWSHAEGKGSIASGSGSHAEGVSKAIGSRSHSQGFYTIASGEDSHAGGRGFSNSSNVVASGRTSFIHFELTNPFGDYGAYGDYSVILGGTNHNVLSGSTSSSILGGSNNTINSGTTNSTIIGGSGNTINAGVTGSTILGGNNITATTSSTVYVPTLNIVTTPLNDNALTDLLVRDSSGLVKYRSVSSISSSGIFTGGTVSGATNFINGLTANTISATTYQNLPTDLTLTEPSSNDTFGGELLKVGTGTTVAGYTYYLNSSNGWSLTNASGLTFSTGLIGVAVGTNPSVNGMLTRGTGRSTNFTGTTGSPLYLTTTSGILSEYPPSGVGNVVRIVGYKLNQTNSIMFAPDPTWVEL